MNRPVKERKKVVITGMGVISTAGYDLDSFWNTLYNGKVTYGKMDDYKDNKNYRINIGARIKDTAWYSQLTESFDSSMGMASNYAVFCTNKALENAGLDMTMLPSGRTTVSIGTTMGEVQVEEKISELRKQMPINEIPHKLLKQYSTDNIGKNVQKAIKAKGTNYNVPTACAAGNYSITLASKLIESGQIDVAVAGGVDVFSRVAFTGFQRLLSLAPDFCRPFDKNRKGLVVGEGCGIFILESADFARARGAKAIGEILGSGLTSDRYHMTAPHPEGDGAVRAMNIALKEAQLSLEDIDYISAHATGTPINDKIEVKAMEKVFGINKIPPTSSIKSMLGHAMGAASALELIASLQMMERGVILPTVNYVEKDPQCSIDCVPNSPRASKLNYALSNSFAFGGQVSSLIVKRGGLL